MKKILPLIVSCFFVLLACVAFAQDFNSYYDPEKIYLFDVKIDVQTDGSINITENITLNVKHQQIRRGIYRDIPVSFDGQLKPISLTMDGQTHPFFTENKGRNSRINFGNDNYIQQGRHTYSFKYTYKNAIKFFKDYDELYWNITGNDWNFTIDKARAQVNLPAKARVQTNGISLYTGRKGAKDSNARQVGNLIFETTRPLSYREGFTIAVPFDKGVVQEPPLLTRIKDSLSFSVLLSFVLFIFLVVYAIFSWLKVGRDPAYSNIVRYEPPEGISPAFVYYLYNEKVNAKLMSSILLSLSMKGYLEIQVKDNGFLGGKKTSLIRKKPVTDGLPEEEDLLIRRLLGYAGSYAYCLLDKSKSSILNQTSQSITNIFKKEAKSYIMDNKKYKVIAICLVLAMGVIPFTFNNFEYTSFLMFVNIMSALYVLINGYDFKILYWFLMMLFVVFVGDSFLISPDLIICQCLFLISILCVPFYISLIKNVTLKGKEMFEKLNGFKKYIETAEVNRFAASNPMDEERIFCEYLPYAYAMGLQNQWIKKFTNTLSQATIDKCVACAGGVAAVSGALASGVSSSMPSGRGSGRSGSFGGGHSGGGHGGGGGGGR